MEPNKDFWDTFMGDATEGPEDTSPEITTEEALAAFAPPEVEKENKPKKRGRPPNTPNKKKLSAEEFISKVEDKEPSSKSFPVDVPPATSEDTKASTPTLPTISPETYVLAVALESFINTIFKAAIENSRQEDAKSR